VKYPYILNTGRLKKFIEMIPKIGVPPKITQPNLPTLGFKSANDRPIVTILRFINFIDANNVPTEDYRAFRDSSKAGTIMATALKKAYAELFEIYPDAYDKDDESLKNFFAPTTDAGEQVVMQTVTTFKALCSFANFKAIPKEEEKKREEGEEKIEERKQIPQIPAGVTINLNIQLALPATDDATVYDRIFKALKENLLSRE